METKYNELFVSLQRAEGRSGGKIVTRHKGSRGKIVAPRVDREQTLPQVPAVVSEIQKNTLTTGHLARLVFFTGYVGYILAPSGLCEGDYVVNFKAGSQVSDEYIKNGNGFILSDIPAGTLVYGVELKPGEGETFVRSAGAYATCLGLSADGKHMVLELPSKERRKVLASCKARVGRVSNEKHWLNEIGSAGASRLLGRRPHVRGVAMNPVDHPHGGGEGKTSGGRHPVSPWGLLAKGKKTRRTVNKFVLSKRVK